MEGDVVRQKRQCRQRQTMLREQTGEGERNKTIRPKGPCPLGMTLLPVTSNRLVLRLLTSRRRPRRGNLLRLEEHCRPRNGLNPADDPQPMLSETNPIEIAVIRNWENFEFA